jgi:cytochrome c5
MVQWFFSAPPLFFAPIVRPEQTAAKWLREGDEAMKKIPLCLLTMMVSVPILLWSGGAWGDSTELGRKIYAEKCQFCHGIKGDGNSPAAVTFNPKPQDFNSPKFWQMNDDKKIEAVIKQGRGMMPAFDMNADEIKAVIGYLSKRFEKSKNK